MSDIPGINPWLPVKRMMRVEGYDQFGRREVHNVEVELRPDYYFWLGADAYHDWPVVTNIVPAISRSWTHQFGK